MNRDINKIINFTKSINSRIIDMRKVYSFSSQDICENKILVLNIKSKRNIYRYINEAIDKGIIGLIVTVPINEDRLIKNIPVLHTNYLKDNLNIFLDYLYESPLKSKKVIGVTGTDGKTSTCHLIAECLTALGKRVGIISTEGNGVYPRLKQSKYTTPRSDILYEEFSIFRDKNVDTVIIECSSQGLDQGRLNNIIFTYSVITNIHKDHIEYHKTFKNYVESKIKLLNMTKKHFFINEDCKDTISNYSNIKQSKIIVYGKYLDAGKINDLVKPSNISKDLIIQTNRALLYKYLLNENQSLKTIRGILNKKFKAIKGRMNYFSDKRNSATYIIDYAHTEQALDLVLKYAKVKSGKSVLITLFGCGGNRDKGKRSRMGIIAKKYSDKIILTDDNPRNEDSMNIINDIHKKIKDKSNIYIIPNRKKAIKKAFSMSKKDHIVVLAGKGNEDYIVYKDKSISHNDIKYLKKLIK
jgi:UDP-N-acetylmuramoyl-L-alanyl-D-glutamate--2,6-diaminopimelate ligase